MKRWLVVTGGAHRSGGQDRANLELIRYLADDRDREVHVVTHQADAEVLSWPRLTVHLIPRPLGSIALGERLLERQAEKVHTELGPSAIVLANGGNYSHAIVNWVHSLHSAWPVLDAGAPLSRRFYAQMKKRDDRKRERRAIGAGRLIIANSSKTAHDLERELGVSPDRIVVVAFGSDPRPKMRPDRGWKGRLGFIGALGWDRNKGLDTALHALKRLVDLGHSEMTLAVAGAGSTAPWIAQATRLGLRSRVQFLGHLDDIRSLLAELDLVVSPVRYEAYGLAIQEALVSGVPALVSARAGIGELLRKRSPELVVEHHESPAAWEAAVSAAKASYAALLETTDRVGGEFASRPWKEMARELVAAAEYRR